MVARDNGSKFMINEIFHVVTGEHARDSNCDSNSAKSGPECMHTKFK
jgi:hypothetical protein